MVDSFSSGRTTRDNPSRSGAFGDHEGSDPTDRNKVAKARNKLGGGFFGGGFFGGDLLGKRGSPEVRERVLRERMEQANRLGFTQTILGGRPPTAGKAGTLDTAVSDQGARARAFARWKERI